MTTKQWQNMSANTHQLLAKWLLDRGCFQCNTILPIGINFTQQQSTSSYSPVRTSHKELIQFCISFQFYFIFAFNSVQFYLVSRLDFSFQFVFYCMKTYSFTCVSISFGLQFQPFLNYSLCCIWGINQKHGKMGTLVQNCRPFSSRFTILQVSNDQSHTRQVVIKFLPN